MKGYLESQIGLAEKVKPRGAIRVKWLAFLESEVEREDTLMWARREEEMKLVEELKDVDMKKPLTRYISGLIP